MSSKIPQIPLPHFPHAHRSSVDQQVHSILAQLVVVFPSAEPPISGQDGGDDLSHLWEELEILNGNICGQVLQLATAHLLLKQLNATYESLKDRHRRLTGEIHRQERDRKSRAPVFPAEVLQMVCSFTTSIRSYGSRNPAQAAWPQIFNKSVPLQCNIKDFLRQKSRDATKNGAHLDVEFRGRSLETFLSILSKATPISANFGIWKAIDFEIPPEGPQACAEVLRRCRPWLSTVEHAGVRLYSGALCNLPQLLDAYIREENFKDLKLPACTSLFLPLPLVPWFRDIISGIPRLEVDCTFPSTRALFTTPFEGVDLGNLRSLSIHAGCSRGEEEFKTDISLHIPKLQRLIFKTSSVAPECNILTSVLKWIVCERLERLDLLCSIYPEDYSSYSFHSFISCVASHCKFLKRLSLHHFKSMEWAICRRLHSDILPNLEHLSISLDMDKIDTVVDDLVDMLQYRKNRLRVHTLEIHISPDLELGHQQQFQVEYIGLHVKNVLIIPRSY